jgi:hypothetical protein
LRDKYIYLINNVKRYCDFMANITTNITITPERLKPNMFTEADIHLSVGSKDSNLYWVECIVEVPHPLSLAPDKTLFIGKLLIGILGQGNTREKRIKFYGNSSVTSNVYQIKLTFYLYGEDGVIEDRKEIYKSVECGEINAKIL